MATPGPWKVHRRCRNRAGASVEAERGIRSSCRTGRMDLHPTSPTRRLVGVGCARTARLVPPANRTRALSTRPDLPSREPLLRGRPSSHHSISIRRVSIRTTARVLPVCREREKSEPSGTQLSGGFSRCSTNLERSLTSCDGRSAAGYRRGAWSRPMVCRNPIEGPAVHAWSAEGRLNRWKWSAKLWVLACSCSLTRAATSFGVRNRSRFTGRTGGEAQSGSRLLS
jgi:hypothetical protein